MRGLGAEETDVLADFAAHSRGIYRPITWAEHYRRVPILRRLERQRRTEPNDRGGWQITPLGLLALRVSVAIPAVSL